MESGFTIWEGKLKYEEQIYNMGEGFEIWRVDLQYGERI